MVGIARQRHEFRISWWIRGVTLGALALWCAVGSWALLTGSVPTATLAGIGFFVAFFVIFTRYYWAMTYVVDDTGVTVRRGMAGIGHFPWETIESVRRSDVPLVGWEVVTNRGMFVLDFFVSHRARLIDVIVARAGLFPT